MKKKAICIYTPKSHVRVMPSVTSSSSSGSYSFIHTMWDCGTMFESFNDRSDCPLSFLSVSSKLQLALSIAMRKPTLSLV